MNPENSTQGPVGPSTPPTTATPVQAQPVATPNSQPITTKSLSKSTALVLAVLFGTLTWLYTYRRDRKKFWITLIIGVSAFTVRTIFDTFTVDVIVDLYALIVYVWAIVDVARKPSAYFTQYPAYQDVGSEATLAQSQQVVPTQASDDAINQTLMPTKNKFAIKSYYYSCVGIFPVIGLPFSVLAITNGRKALEQYKVNPTPGAKGHARFGIILGIIELVFFALLLFAAVDFVVR